MRGENGFGFYLKNNDDTLHITEIDKIFLDKLFAK